MPCESDAGLKCGNWLTKTELVVRSFSESAGPWWTKTVAEATDAYQIWANSDPLERLRLVPTAAAEPEYKLTLLVAKVAANLLEAIPKQMSEAMIAAKVTDPAGILFRILKMYQPGGVEERTTLLKKLTETEQATSPASAVTALELWTSRRNRAEEMKLSIPDPSIQLKAVLTVVSKVMGGQAEDMQQMAFRMMAARNDLKVA